MNNRKEIAKRYYRRLRHRLSRAPGALSKWLAANRERARRNRQKLRKDPVRNAIFLAKQAKRHREHLIRIKKDPELRAAFKKKRAEYWRKHCGLPLPTRCCPAKCECCGRKKPVHKSLDLDHCHESGVFRGWLCAGCNRGIGMLGDDLVSVRRAVRYLERVCG
jgi:hypothetical protein